MTSSDSTNQEETPQPEKHSKQITNDDLYRRSTQFRFWSFTEQRLKDLKRSTNEKGAANLKERISQLDPSIPEVSEIWEKDLVKPLTVEEEVKIVEYYARKAQGLANYFKLPTQSRATAISFFRKFFLVNSCIQFHPQYIMYTCLFLAAKSDNHFIGIKEFSKAIPKTTPESILQYEFQILQSLKFALLCHHPYKPLYGFFLDFQVEMKNNIQSDKLAELYDHARDKVSEALFSDVSFLFTPSQIALAAYYELNPELVTSYLSKKFSQLSTINEDEQLKPSPNIQTKLVDNLKHCIELSHASFDPEIEEVTQISRKVHYCIDPMKLVKKMQKQKAVS
ncbi:Cyclin [Komagataella phaffii CBS 7435]|uniref:Cyclin associated with protein kinase Kin28p n=2 Tax=Komagataella phaffii TaxID=460519 RepID=C4R4Y7_KOMPG|nr:Cyclin associated with protein kinase Kin28p [Komagataella phaffii GS115]AOA64164.1 GQ67_03650T0 [Komagataella phaffii]CAH2449610.1 Cyclin [Komagataella phaffii CBS 7435]AOA68973.1 GQ68_03622T0 [Komagataella phaffii GS115]CAY70623.1 Cyclin associated with protein kinase Kin28p [Komagataella phaffii GS115]CCA39588.1 Cyclin [Komagataella phaffii CBS 7435]